MVRCNQGYRVRWVPLGQEHGFEVADLLAEVSGTEHGHRLVFRPPPLGYLRDAFRLGTEGAFSVSRRGKPLEDYRAVVTSVADRNAVAPNVPAEVVVDLSRVA